MMPRRTATDTRTDPVVIVGAGQAGLAAARAVRAAGLEPLILEAADRPGGSWPHHYDSLRLFSPARHSAMPDFPMEGDPDRYPTGRETAEYLERYAAHLQVDIRTRTRVSEVLPDGPGFFVRTENGDELPAAGLVAATGSYGNPLVPDIPGQENFTGELLHSADYRNPEPYAGRRVVVVGGGNSGVQIAHELAQVADLTLATLQPLSFLAQQIQGRDLHHWLDTTGFDRLPLPWVLPLLTAPLILDTGSYREAIESGRVERRPMFSHYKGEQVIWSDGTPEPVDAVILATGYQPDLGYLRSLGALDDHGMPQHAGGLSTTHPGLVYLGLEFQRSFSSNTLRGVSRDADFVVGALAAHVRGAPAAIGIGP